MAKTTEEQFKEFVGELSNSVYRGIVTDQASKIGQPMTKYERQRDFQSILQGLVMFLISTVLPQMMPKINRWVLNNTDFDSNVVTGLLKGGHGFDLRSFITNSILKLISGKLSSAQSEDEVETGEEDWGVEGIDWVFEEETVDVE